MGIWHRSHITCLTGTWHLLAECNGCQSCRPRSWHCAIPDCCRWHYHQLPHLSWHVTSGLISQAVCILAPTRVVFKQVQGQLLWFLFERSVYFDIAINQSLSIKQKTKFNLPNISPQSLFVVWSSFVTTRSIIQSIRLISRGWPDWPRLQNKEILPGGEILNVNLGGNILSW